MTAPKEQAIHPKFQGAIPGQINPYGALPIPRVTPDLLGLIRSGKVYSLEIPHYEGIPVPGPMVPFSLAPRLRHGDLAEIKPASAAAETITMAIHTATHVDALCHIGEHQDEQGNPSDHGEVRLYAAPGQTVAANQMVNYRGQHHLDASQMPPVINRGILLDVAGYQGRDVLPDSYEVTEADIRATLAWEKVTLAPQTTVLLRTGFYCHLSHGNPAYQDAIAGLGLGAARFLSSHGMNLVGADNMTVESIPPMNHRVHRFLLVHHGITLLENVFLEDLARDRVYEFLFIMLPLRIQGATGSWVHPIAVS